MKKQALIMIVFLYAIGVTNSALAIQKPVAHKVELQENRYTKQGAKERKKLVRIERKADRQNAKVQGKNAESRSKASSGKNALLAIGCAFAGTVAIVVIFTLAITSSFSDIGSELKIRTGDGLGG